MSNTPTRRLENSCMPPKKSAWRFQNTKILGDTFHESQFAESININNRNMGIMSNNCEVEPVSKISNFPMRETFSYTKSGQSEDAPLDFSLKTGSNPKCKTEPVGNLIKPFEKCELKEGDIVANHSPREMFLRAKMLNGNNSPPSPKNGSPTLLDTSHATSSCKGSDPLDMDCYQGCNKSPLRSPSSHASRTNEERHQSNSPEHPHLSRENSPSGEKSILEGMLRSQQQSNTNMLNGSTVFETGCTNGLSIFENQMLSSPTSPIPINAPVIHPASMLPFAMAPYFGYSYIEHPTPFVPNYMYKPPEYNISDSSFARKPRKRHDTLTDSLKGCSVDELRKKLDSLSSDNSPVINSDYNHCKPSYASHVDNGKRFSNSASPELVKSAINSINNCKKENNEIDSGVPNYNQINNKINPGINQKIENGTTITHINTNVTNRNVENYSETNGINSTASVSSTEDTNDSIASAMQESPNDGLKRKSFPDYKSDPLYKIKRAKNNLAARRSRESRRIKEELIRKTANVLEQQNKAILRDYATLKFSYEETQVKYYALMKEYENMKIQNSVLVERLNQKRCGQCGSALPMLNW